MIRIRFVTSNDPLSALIRAQAGVSMPFTPSHAEALSQDGKTYIGAHYNGGVLARPVGYDADSLMTLPDGNKSERIVALPCTPEQEAAFYYTMTTKLGEAYDWKAIFGFTAPDLHTHLTDHIICSALVTAALRSQGCDYFKWPTTVPFHHITPRDLMMILSTHVEIPH
jgi:hypothetical protein